MPGADQLRARAHAEQQEDGRDMVLHRAFAEVRELGDLLVGLALEHPLQHLHLARRELLPGAGVARRGDRRLRRRRGEVRHSGAVGAEQSAGADEAHHLLQVRRLRQEGARAQRQRALGERGVAGAREHHDARRGKALAELGEPAEAARVGQRQVEQHQADRRLVAPVEHQRVGDGAGLEHLQAGAVRRGLGLHQGADAEPQQVMVVDHQDRARRARRRAGLVPGGRRRVGGR